MSGSEGIAVMDLGGEGNETGAEGEQNICAGEQLISMKLSSISVIVSLVLLGIINICVIFGNILVIVSVFVTSKLRTVTNFFIVSLAVADLLVGVAVIPYSLSYEVLDVWVFGDIWCKGWLATDVLLCTASILNLCAISVDRYLAVTRPVRYRSMMTSKRAKIIIAGVWMLSFLICFPPLVGWSYNRGDGPLLTMPVPTTTTIHPAAYTVPSPSTHSGTTLPSLFDEILTSGEKIGIRVKRLQSPAATGGASTLSSLTTSDTTGGMESFLQNASNLIMNQLPLFDSLDNFYDHEDQYTEYHPLPSSSPTVLLASASSSFPSSASSIPSLSLSSHLPQSSSIPQSSPFSGDTLNTSPNSQGDSLSKYELYSSDSDLLPPVNVELCDEVGPKCKLFDDKGYVIYSALGSFFIPMFVMIFFYWRIYLIASRTSRALKRGFRTTKSKKKKSSGGVGGPMSGTESSDVAGGGFGEERLTLRIHRSGYCATDEVVGHYMPPSAGHGRHIHQAPTSGTDTTSLRVSSVTNSSASPRASTRSQSSQRHATIDETCFDEDGATPANQPPKPRRKMPITLYKSRLSAPNGDPNTNGAGSRRPSPSTHSTLSVPSSSTPSRENSGRSAKLAMTRFSKRTNKWQARRFHAETKAAKTVGIIVGGFICCWLPFFTCYLVRAFCPVGCIPDLLFSIFTWLGYCNSAINPFIYGLFNRDFRRAFKNILCRCTFHEETVSSLIRQIHLPTFLDEMPEDTRTHSQDD